MYGWGYRFLTAAASFTLLTGLIVTAARAQATVKVGHDQPEPSTHHQAALKWKELVEQRTGGKLKVQVFPSSQLGSGTQMVEQVQAGALEIAILPTAWIAPLAPSVQVLDLPFLFPKPRGRASCGRWPGGGCDLTAT